MAVDPAQTASRVVRELEGRGLACAIGGALCLAFWGVPRATKDLDINVFVGDDQLDALLAALRAAGLSVDGGAARARVLERGDLVAFDGEMRVDVFVAFHPYHAEVQRRVTRGVLPDGTEAAFLSAEDLCIFKTLFYRAKDLVDLDRLFAARGAELDMAHVLRWLVTLIGDDPRVADLAARQRRILEAARESD